MAHKFNRIEYDERKSQRQAVRIATNRLNQVEKNIVGSTTIQTQRAIKDMASYMQKLISFSVSD